MIGDITAGPTLAPTATRACCNCTPGGPDMIHAGTLRQHLFAIQQKRKSEGSTEIIEWGFQQRLYQWIWIDGQTPAGIGTNTVVNYRVGVDLFTRRMGAPIVSSPERRWQK